VCFRFPQKTVILSIVRSWPSNIHTLHIVINNGRKQRGKRILHDECWYWVQVTWLCRWRHNDGSNIIRRTRMETKKWNNGCGFHLCWLICAGYEWLHLVFKELYECVRRVRRVRSLFTRSFARRRISAIDRHSVAAPWRSLGMRSVQYSFFLDRNSTNHSYGLLPSQYSILLVLPLQTTIQRITRHSALNHGATRQLAAVDGTERRATVRTHDGVHRSHNFQLPLHTSALCDCNFVIRMLYTKLTIWFNPWWNYTFAITRK